jgi:hypothetical protein
MESRSSGVSFQRAFFASFKAPPGGKAWYTVVNPGTTSAVGFQFSAFGRTNAGAGGNLKLPETAKLLALSYWLLASRHSPSVARLARRTLRGPAGAT